MTTFHVGDRVGYPLVTPSIYGHVTQVTCDFIEIRWDGTNDDARYTLRMLEILQRVCDNCNELREIHAGFKRKCPFAPTTWK